ncbi:barstar family protein [Micromonospora sp. NPDC050397]|uniref:barstar family protein n=1 Tax=Micromonospora sp. NPDC050397 TaxID=3364279 RepID=UPI00384F98AA
MSEGELPSWLTVSTGSPPPTRSAPSTGSPPPTDAAPPTDALVVDGTGSRTRAGLFAGWAVALSFPDYFGHNWDALFDCLRDLTDTGPLTLVVTDAADLLADEPPAQLGILLAVLGTVAREPGRRLRVVLRTDAESATGLRRRLAAATG